MCTVKYRTGNGEAATEEIGKKIFLYQYKKEKIMF